MNNTNTDKHMKDGKNNKTVILTSIAVVAVLCIIAVICWPIFNHVSGPVKDSSQPTASDYIKKGNLPSMTNEDIEKAKKNKQDASSFSVQVDSTGTMAKNSNILKLGIGNPLNNIDHCTVDILENNQMLFSSKDMEPQTYMTEMKLNKSLSVGTHQIVVRYNVYVNQKKIGSMDVKTKIVVG
jgi:hypothetical protein